MVEGGYAYIGHMAPPVGTRILDVCDPAEMRVVSQITVPADIHSHKVRVIGDVMLVNYERFPEDDGRTSVRSGSSSIDIADRRRPREISFFPTRGRGRPPV